MACPAALVDGLPVALLGREQIEVSETDGIHLGTNGLPIRPDAYVTDPAFRHIGDRIARHDVTVEVRRLRNLPQLRRIVPVQHPVALAE